MGSWVSFAVVESLRLGGAGQGDLGWGGWDGEGKGFVGLWKD
jgi:hypothetical protein